MCGRRRLRLEREGHRVRPSAVTSTFCETGFSVGLHARRARARPGRRRCGTSRRRRPRVQWPFGTDQHVGAHLRVDVAEDLDRPRASSSTTGGACRRPELPRSNALPGRRARTRCGRRCPCWGTRAGPGRHDRDARRELLVLCLISSVWPRAGARAARRRRRTTSPIAPAVAAHAARDRRRASCAPRRRRRCWRRRGARARCGGVAEVPATAAVAAAASRARRRRPRCRILRTHVVALLLRLHQLDDQLPLLGELLLEARESACRRATSAAASVAAARRSAPAPRARGSAIRRHASARIPSCPSGRLAGVLDCSCRVLRRSPQRLSTRLLVNTSFGICGMPPYSPLCRYSALRTARVVSTQRTPPVARHDLVTVGALRSPSQTQRVAQLAAPDDPERRRQHRSRPRGSRRCAGRRP